MTQHMADINDRDHLILLHLPSIRTSETCTDNLSEGLLPLQGSVKGLFRPHNRLKSHVYTMEEGIDNPAFTTLGEVELQTIDNDIKTAIPGSGVTEKENQDPISSADYEEGPCGWGRFTPSFLQCCNNPKGYLVMYSLLAVLQGTAVNGLVNVVISTIEKRYDLNSSLTGLVSASYDISFCVLSLFVSFYGQRGHKPRWLAFSAFMIGLGSIVFSLPHFTTSRYQYGNRHNDFCETSGNNSTGLDCTGKKGSSLSNYLYVFILGQLLMGVGGTPLYTLGTAFFDDSLPTHKSSLYIGIAYGMSVVGPAVGYLIGSQTLDIYIDFEKKKINDVPLSPNDPRWLGAWWIAFVIVGLTTWLLIMPFSCFPKHLPGTAAAQSKRISEAHNNGSEGIVEAQNIGKTFKDFPLALLLLVKNPVLMALTFASCADAFITTGFATFLPKFIENQFSLTSSFAAILGGGVLIPAAAIGQVIGGVIVSKFKFDCKNIIRFSIILSFVSIALVTVFIFAKCGNEPFAGVTVAYNGTDKRDELSSLCNENCSCARSYYDPVCGVDGVQYFSSCYAGCLSTNVSSGGMKTFTNCSCIGDPSQKKFKQALHLNEAISGKCESTCTNLILFMVFFFFVVVTTFMTATPTTMAILRCVPDKQRSFALGVQWALIRLLGSIPGPILFGVTIDSSCILWNLNDCEVKGACWIYNNTSISYKLVGISAASKIITIIFLFIAYFIYKPPASTKDSQNSQNNVKIISSDSL
ncbi:PREDICTED: solute carrier organic anion transporter family member 4C1 [Nanorana parkeri]|uniref:solute carrier organic anion transporter family member 4C1 n=1 Tax=Nanorana parkeri TaxID=125878 RepID=UPI0008549418|nr:PREDICTED: solute carrier organic anion transporter family member 4C1 [Nanorana parkeri]